MPGPLSGVKVVEFCTMISGPLATMILADQGADVVKVESSAGDGSRGVATRRGGFSAAFLNNNRNKRSTVPDLKSAEGLEAAKRLIAQADVLVQNFRPGVMERLGLGFEQAKEINPRIIYASVCGFGETGPYAHKPVFDPLIQSLSGLTSIQAGADDRRPVLVRTIVPDKVTAFALAQAICAALFARERQGIGQHIHLSMLDTVVHFLWSSDMGGHTFVGDELAQETAQSFIDLIYETSDGYISVAAFRRIDWEKLAEACDKPEWKVDPRFLTSEGLEVHKNERLEMTQDRLREQTTALWLERLGRFDVPHAPVLTRKEMIHHPQVAANKILDGTQHPQAGLLRQTRTPAIFDATPATQVEGAPELGQHTRQVLAELGYSPTEIQQLTA